MSRSPEGIKYRSVVCVSGTALADRTITDRPARVHGWFTWRAAAPPVTDTISMVQGDGQLLARVPGDVVGGSEGVFDEPVHAEGIVIENSAATNNALAVVIFEELA